MVLGVEAGIVEDPESRASTRTPLLSLPTEDAIAQAIARGVLTRSQARDLIAEYELSGEGFRDHARDNYPEAFAVAAVEFGGVAAVIAALREDTFPLGLTPGDRRLLDSTARNATYGGYNVGKYRASLRRDVARGRPIYEYLTVGDERVRPNHAALSGRLFEIGSDAGDYYYPPNGHRCRCAPRTLSTAEAGSRQVYSSRIGGLDPDEGWRGAVKPFGT